MKSISETVELIQVNIEKVSNVNQSVTNITNDATSLGENIKVVDSAVKEVETSNQTLTDNMHQVGEVMEVMTQSISGAELTTNTRRVQRVRLISRVLSANLWKNSASADSWAYRM